MNQEEKLERFQALCMEDAKAQYLKETEEYRTGLEEVFRQHQEGEKRRQALRLQIAEAEIERESRRELSLDQIRIRRTFSKKQDALKAQLFAEVRNKLASYRKTEAYVDSLKQRIGEIRQIAGGDLALIYIDPGDEALLPGLPQGVQLSRTSFEGGVIGVIPSRNIGIDRSFRTKLDELEREFHFAQQDAVQDLPV